MLRPLPAPQLPAPGHETEGNVGRLILELQATIDGYVDRLKALGKVVDVMP